MLVFLDLEASVEVSAGLLEGLVVVVSVVEACEEACVVAFLRRVVAEISLTRNFTPTILVLTNQLPLVVEVVVVEVD
jgi:hypothetical protein